jgi:hypothetical protein
VSHDAAEALDARDRLLRIRHPDIARLAREPLRQSRPRASHQSPSQTGLIGPSRYSVSPDGPGGFQQTSPGPGSLRPGPFKWSTRRTQLRAKVRRVLVQTRVPASSKPQTAPPIDPYFQLVIVGRARTLSRATIRAKLRLMHRSKQALIKLPPGQARRRRKARRLFPPQCPNRRGRNAILLRTHAAASGGRRASC